MRASRDVPPGLKPRGSITVAILVVLCVATALSAGQAKPGGRQPLPTPVPVPQPAPPLVPLDKVAELWVDQTFKKMTLDDKVGQLVMSEIDSMYLAADTAQFDQLIEKVKTLKLGGFVVFGGTERAPSVRSCGSRARASRPG